jgi:amidase
MCLIMAGALALGYACEVQFLKVEFGFRATRLTGNALETSIDWTFTVDVIRGLSIQNPRLENADYWMASGIANSLPEALQAATTNLSRFLEEEYKLNANEIGIVLGTAIRYDVAEIVDPLVHVVARIEKRVLSRIAK